MALSWTFYLLSLHPGARRTLEEEVDAAPALAGAPRRRGPARASVTRGWCWTRRCGSTRPRGWSRGSADGPDEIGGFAIPAGSRVLLSPYVTQHDPALWDDPEGFDPERFAPEAQAAAAGRPALRLLPVRRRPAPLHRRRLRDDGGDIVLATVARRLRLDLEPGRPVAIEPLVTLRPTPGIWMTARPR